MYGEDFFQKNITWLDIGCGHGEFLLALKNISNNNIIAEGIEPNEHKVKSAIKKGLNVSNTDLGKLQKKYDVISFLNVYSHLPNPPEIISEWKKLLNTNGEFLLETGDTANLSPDIHYRPLDLPDHLSFASEEIVKHILAESEFTVLDVKKYPTIKPTLKNISKEIIKIFIPNRISRIKSIINYKQYSQTDMWIRAKVTS
jgi:SAM-dependent methyltransferase